jgi:hypothetical protein
MHLIAVAVDGSRQDLRRGSAYASPRNYWNSLFYGTGRITVYQTVRVAMHLTPRDEYREAPGPSRVLRLLDRDVDPKSA